MTLGELIRKYQLFPPRVYGPFGNFAVLKIRKRTNKNNAQIQVVFPVSVHYFSIKAVSAGKMLFCEKWCKNEWN